MVPQYCRQNLPIVSEPYSGWYIGEGDGYWGVLLLREWRKVGSFQ